MTGLIHHLLQSLYTMIYMVYSIPNVVVMCIHPTYELLPLFDNDPQSTGHPYANQYGVGTFNSFFSTSISTKSN